MSRNLDRAFDSDFAVFFLECSVDLRDRCLAVKDLFYVRTIRVDEGRDLVL